MDLLQIIALGIVQAITEWLPLSSKTMTTALYLGVFGGQPENAVKVLLFLHLGTVLAAVAYFRKEIAFFAQKLLGSARQWKAAIKSERRIGFFASSILFTGAVGIPLLAIEWMVLPSLDGSALFSLMGAGLVATGFMITSQNKNKWRSAESASWEDGVLTGALQGFSVLPGVSRAGTTTTALIWRGFSAESAFQLSFLLSIPVVLGMEILLWGLQFAAGGSLSSVELAEGAALAASSFFFGYLTIGFLMRQARSLNVAYLAFIFGMIMLAAGLSGLG